MIRVKYVTGIIDDVLTSRSEQLAIPTGGLYNFLGKFHGFAKTDKALVVAERGGTRWFFDYEDHCSKYLTPEECYIFGVEKASSHADRDKVFAVIDIGK